MSSLHASDSKALSSDSERTIRRLLGGYPEQERALLQEAFKIAGAAQGGQRHSIRSLAIAEILYELKLDHETLAAALLHHVMQDSNVDLAHLRDRMGPTVTTLAEGVIRMEAIGEYSGHGDTGERQQLELLKKLLLATASDVRVVIIKLADRLHDMRTLRHMEGDIRQHIASETLQIYAPLASRLGVAQIKWEMEDLALRELQPHSYRTIAHQLDERRVDRQAYVQRVVALLTAQLAQQGISAEVTGRAKHINSIYHKMQDKNLSFDQVFDVRAVRILVADVAACYSALGVVHSLWKHVAKEFDDYIANPKSNGYQSLHTTVLGPDGKTLEAQIRSHEMHIHAEFGVAAHWRYKEGRAAAPEQATAGWLQQILQVKDDSEGPQDFLDRFNSELLEDRIYVVTPQGRVLDLQQGATPLDFAYQVHTELGHRCRGAKVNGMMVPLTKVLRSGDQVEVLTARNGTPSRDWLRTHLGYLATARARAKVRHWFKHQDRDKNVVSGQDVLQREMRRLGVATPDRELLLKRFNYLRYEDLLAGIGGGDVSSAQIARALQHSTPQAVPTPVSVPTKPERTATQQATRSPGILVEGVGNLLTQMAHCCQPVPNDPIVGFITRGRGVSVHRRDCHNMLRLDVQRRARLVDVDWPGEALSTYAVNVVLRAYDRQGLLRDVSAILTAQRVNIEALSTNTNHRDQTTQTTMTLHVSSLEQLSRVLDLFTQLPNVFEAHRVS
jgi:GTP pyrophosphokinase